MSQDITGIDNDKIQWFHKLREHPKNILCIKDCTCGSGFGKTIKAGEKVMCNGLIFDGSYKVCIPDQCGFYYFDNFEMIDFNF